MLPVQKLLLPLDGSAVAEVALAVAVAMAEGFGFRTFRVCNAFA